MLARESSVFASAAGFCLAVYPGRRPGMVNCTPNISGPYAESTCRIRSCAQGSGRAFATALGSSARTARWRIQSCFPTHQDILANLASNRQKQWTRLPNSAIPGALAMALTPEAFHEWSRLLAFLADRLELAQPRDSKRSSCRMSQWAPPKPAGVGCLLISVGLSNASGAPRCWGALFARFRLFIHDSEEIGPRMLSRSPATGPQPNAVATPTSAPCLQRLTARRH